MSSLRKKESEETFQDFMKKTGKNEPCSLCNKPSVKDFQDWRIVENSFPYDRIASTHHMIVPRRHVAESELNDNERAGLIEIKKDAINSNYEYVIEATNRKKSNPAHFHLHLILLSEHND